jgi:hypothetical protein
MSYHKNCSNMMKIVGKKQSRICAIRVNPKKFPNLPEIVRNRPNSSQFS